MSKKKTVQIRQEKLKQALLEQLKRTPTIELSCEKSGISRATYYRWCKKSKKFAQQADEAIIEGRLFISDIAESQIFSLIKDRKIDAIRLWLTHNSPRYANKLELSGTVATKDEALTPEQKKIVRRALELANWNRNYGKENDSRRDSRADGEKPSNTEKHHKA